MSDPPGQLPVHSGRMRGTDVRKAPLSAPPSELKAKSAPEPSPRHGMGKRCVVFCSRYQPLLNPWLNQTVK